MSENYYARRERAKQHIEHRFDGPLTPFVMIMRAMDLLRADETMTATAAGNALHDALDERGWLRDGMEETDS